MLFGENFFNVREQNGGLHHWDNILMIIIYYWINCAIVTNFEFGYFILISVMIIEC